MLANLKTAISVRGFTQDELAIDVLKITPSFLSMIIHEQRRADTSLKARIAKALQCDEQWLFSSVTRVPGPATSARSEENVEMPAVALAGGR